jgi:hypothetical protein
MRLEALGYHPGRTPDGRGRPRIPTPPSQEHGQIMYSVQGVLRVDAEGF